MKFTTILSLIVITLLTAVMLIPCIMTADTTQFLSTDDRINVSTGTIPDSVEIIWEAQIDGVSYSSPIVADGKVYIGSGDDGEDYLYCFDADDGSPVWTFDTIKDSPSDFGLACTPCVDDGKIYFGTSNFYAYCLDSSTGTEVWSHDLLVPPSANVAYGACASPMLYNGQVYFGTDNFDHGPNLFCLDAAGNGDGTTDEVWNFTSSDGNVFFSSPSVSNGKLVVGGWAGRTNGEVLCLDPNGNGDGTTDDDDDDTTDDDDDDTTDESSSGGISTNTKIIIAAVGIIALFIIVLVVMNKGKKSSTDDKPKKKIETEVQVVEVVEIDDDEE